MRKPDLFESREKNALVPVNPPKREPTATEKERDLQESREQLLREYIDATQTPPPGPGGINGITGPYDMRVPVESDYDYAHRIEEGPMRDQRAVSRDRADIADAEKRGDATFAAVRRGDLRDELQSAVDPGNIRTWVIIVGACALFLLVMTLIILLPHGRDTTGPSIGVY